MQRMPSGLLANSCSAEGPYAASLTANRPDSSWSPALTGVVGGLHRALVRLAQLTSLTANRQDSSESTALTGLVGCTEPLTSMECAAEPGVVLKSPATCRQICQVF